MKVYARADEWFPVYDLEDSRDQPNGSWSRHVDLPEDLVHRYRKAQADFSTVHAELEAALHSANRLLPEQEEPRDGAHDAA